MNSISYIATGISPGIAIVLYIYLVLRNNKGFGNLLIKAYIAGAIGSVILLGSLYLAQMTGLNSNSNLYDTLIFSFVFLGFASELGKFLVYKFYILPKAEVDTPIHSMAFSVLVALGFTTVAVLMFVFDLYETKPPYPRNMYLLLAAPSNIIFAVVLGFFVGMSKFIESKISYTLFGLLAASFFNGLFKFCLITHDYKLLNIYAFGAALIVMLLIIKAKNYRP
jgi:protease PrsW